MVVRMCSYACHGTYISYGSLKHAAIHECTSAQHYIVLFELLAFDILILSTILGIFIIIAKNLLFDDAVSINITLLLDFYQSNALDF